MEVEATNHVRAWGALMTKLAAAPADAELANGEMAIWFDAVAAKLKVKAKNSTGVIKTAELALV